MAIEANALKSVAVVATRLGLMRYDQVGQNLLPLIAQTLPPKGRQKRQYWEWADAYPLMRKWIGERSTTRTFKSQVIVDIEHFERTLTLDVRDLELDGDRSLIQSSQDLGVQFSDAFINGRFHFAFLPLRNNDITTYDNQNLFDTDHVHPDGATFSNIFDLSTLGISRSSSGNPTAAEAAREVKAAVNLLQKNRLRNVTVVETAVPSGLVVITRSDGTWGGYWDLLTQDVIGNTTNTWKGKFRLLRDYDPAAGTETSVDYINAEPNGPRPAFFVPAKEPRGLEPDPGNPHKIFKEMKADFGADAEYGFAAGLPQPAVRGQE